MRPSRQAAVAFFVLFLTGCNHRVPVFPDEAGVADGGQDMLVLPDGRADIGVPEICRTEQVSWKLFKDPRGHFHLALPPTVKAVAVSVSGAGGADSAAGLGTTGVAGLVASRPSTAAAPAQEVSKIKEQLSDALAGQGTVTVRAAGSSGASAEGFPAVKEVIWDVSTVSPTTPAALRDRLLAAALLSPLSALGNLPGASTAPSHSLMVKMTVLRRDDGRLVVSAAVANQADYNDLTSDLAFLVNDLGNGTAVASSGKQPTFECDIRTISSKPMADIIWVVDESGSMNDNRQDIVNNANKFFAKALAAGLDFRMGVAGMKKPGGIQLGKFCSDGSGAASDEGGEDRFLLPHESDVFTACVKNPPYYEGGSEYGLTHAYWAVKSHLPRAKDSPHKVREDAHLAVIIVTDEAAQELKEGSELFGEQGFLNYLDYRRTNCQLTPEKQAKLDSFIKPLGDLFASVQATVHLIGGGCNNICNAEMAYGYQELVSAFGGQEGDVCQHDLNATLQVIIDTINASASPRTLMHVPISFTLTVEANGLELPRSRTQGWIYNPTSNSLTFINVQMPKGAVVVASYSMFK